MTESLFQDDELNLRKIPEHWTTEDLLQANGIFFRKDVVQILNTDTAKIKQHARELAQRDQNPYTGMGTHKVWSHWIVRMTLLRPAIRRT